LQPQELGDREDSDPEGGKFLRGDKKGRREGRGEAMVTEERVEEGSRRIPPKSCDESQDIVYNDARGKGRRVFSREGWKTKRRRECPSPKSSRLEKI